MRDFYNLFQKLKHMAAEEDRRREALDLVMILIAVLDGGRGVGLDLDPETREVEAILDQLENKRTPPPPHN
jgi:hypothetical protein